MSALHPGSTDEPEVGQLPALIDRTKQQLDEARDIGTVLQVVAAAEALRAYTKKRGGLVEAHNRLAGIIALAEIKIGKEIKAAQKRGELAIRGGLAGKGKLPNGEFAADPATLADVGVSHKQSSDYQSKAEVEEEVILAAIAEEGAKGREVSKRAINRAVKNKLREKHQPTDPELVAALRNGQAERDLWWPVVQAMKGLAKLPPPESLFASYADDFDSILRDRVPEAWRWFDAFLDKWERREADRTRQLVG